jgi:hypothetical protein
MTDFNYDDSYEEGWDWEYFAGDRFRLHWGIHDLINNPNKKIVRSRDDRDKMTEEEWDLGLYGETQEIKAIKYYFTKPSNYPYENAFIMTKSSWDKVIKKPMLVILISKKTHRMVGIDTVATRDLWTVSEPWWDKERKFYERCYQLPKKYLLTEEQIVEKLQSIRPCMAPVTI